MPGCLAGRKPLGRLEGLSAHQACQRQQDDELGQQQTATHAQLCRAEAALGKTNAQAMHYIQDQANVGVHHLLPRADESHGQARQRGQAAKNARKNVDQGGFGGGCGLPGHHQECDGNEQCQHCEQHVGVLEGGVHSEGVVVKLKIVATCLSKCLHLMVFLTETKVSLGPVALFFISIRRCAPRG